MNIKLRELITPETIISYSSACLNVCDELINLQNFNYKRIIIPSRGAYPFYNGALKALHTIYSSTIEILKFYNNYNVWLLPYTSDWGDINIGLNSAKMREFWTKVLADNIRRLQTPYSKFYNDIVKEVGSQLTLNSSDLTLDKFWKKDSAIDEKFIFIDTAISGKAICEIINAFEKFDLKDYFIILLVDENGAKLKRNYKSLIEKEKQRGLLIQINVEKIFSEDTSPLLNSGISSIVFPSLIEQAYHEVPEFYGSGFVGAGLWFIDSISHLKEFSPRINGVQGSLQSLIYAGILKSLEYVNDENMIENMLDLSVNNMITRLDNINLFNKETTKKLISDRINSKGAKFQDKITVSSSHVVRVDLDSKFRRDFINKIKKY